MKIQFARRGIWWNVTVHQPDGEITQYAFVWPTVFWWLKDQLDPTPPARLLRWLPWRV